MVYLMRHGEAETGGKRFVGQWDVGLTDNGRRQALDWAERLSRVPFAAVYSSDLKRAADTAAAIADGRPVRTLPALREIRLGRWEGRRLDEVRRREPAAWQERGRAFDRFRPPGGGESFADLRDRAVPAFFDLVHRRPEPLLVVAHAGVNRVLLCHLLGMPLANLFRLGQDPAALNLIRRAKESFVVTGINLTPCPTEAFDR